MDLSPLSTAVSVMTSPSVSSYGVPRFYLTPAADGLPSSASREALPDRGMLSELGSRRTPSRLIHRPAIQESGGIMFGRVIAEVLVVNRALVASVLIPFATMGAAAAIAAWILFRRGAGGDSTAVKAEAVPLRNPFSLTEASKFAAFFALVLLVVKLV